MYLRSVSLQDWKAYGGVAKFTFPRPSIKRNIILVGAQNGFGKTSILEALLLALYGKDALPLLARGAGPGEKDIRYASFLQRAFHAGAREQGRTSMSVELEFEDEDGDDERFTLSRAWYFRVDGTYRDEQVAVFVGDGRRPLRSPRLEDDPEDFFRGFIARRTLPSHLAQFFLFDGEQVQRLARTDMAQQVRMGIEGMLGASVLRQLATDLEDYARDRRKAVREFASDGALDKVRDELETLETRREELDRHTREVSEQYESRTKRRNEISNRLQGLQGGNIDSARELQRKRDRVDAELVRLKDQLATILTNDFALGIAGPILRRRLQERLGQERELAAWEGGVLSSKRQLGRFIEEFEKVPPDLSNLGAATTEAVRRKVELAWENMWEPPPEGCADFFRHSYLSENERMLVEGRLQSLAQLGQDSLADLLHAINLNESDKRRYDQQLQTFNAVGSVLEELLEEYQGLASEIGEISSERGQLERELESIKGQLQHKKAEYERLSSRYVSARPELQRISVAQKIAEMLPQLIEDATSRWVADVADRMTEAYREIAHKDTINKVLISPDCTVQLLTKNGVDYRNVDASAGEDQVFSFALISAISRAADVRFPLVIDTPLARLDREHRMNILRHFASNGGQQIILLSQDTELVGEYLDLIRPRIAQTFLLEHRDLGVGIGQNKVLPDRYFE
ncbi:MAG: DNA sulfur modification protein DndD [Polyangiaceae bacterium]|nr:DNA sulfur modification protein DndD [Polyangiaceae bacterium]